MLEVLLPVDLTRDGVAYASGAVVQFPERIGTHLIESGRGVSGPAAQVALGRGAPRYIHADEVAKLLALASGGPALAADKATYLATISTGALIATLVDPYGSGSTFSVVGAAPPTLALGAGGTIVAGAGAQVAGQSSAIVIRAAKGQRAVEELIGFVAVASTSTPTPTPTPTLANLTQVANNTLLTSGAETWWSDQHSLNAGGTQGLVGTTGGSGLQYITQTDGAGVPSDARRLESPAVYTADEHNASCARHLPGGSNALFAFVPHSNAATPTIASMNRLQFAFSPDGTLANMRALVTVTMSGGSATSGVNYGQWVPLSSTRGLFFTNQDNDTSWGLFIVEIVGDTLSVTECRRIFKNIPTGGGGQNQVYARITPNGTNKATIYYQPHPSNARNIIRAVDLNLTTGEITGGGNSYGNAYAAYSAGGALIDFAATPTAGRQEYDPGAGQSVRLLDAFGAGFCGVDFVAADGTNPQHFYIEGGTKVGFGAAGAALDTARRYFRGLVRAREPHTGYRFYRAAVSSGFNILERIDMPTLGGAITRGQMLAASNASVDNRILRPFPFEGATDALALGATVGQYGDYQNSLQSMQLLASAVGTALFNDTFTEAAAILLTAHTSDSGATYTKATEIGAGDLNVGTNGRTYATANAAAGVLASTVMTSQNVDAELTIGSDSAVANQIRVGVRCDAVAHTGYFLNVNQSGQIYAVSRFVAGSGATVISFAIGSGTAQMPTQDVVRMRVRDVGGTTVITLIVNAKVVGTYTDTSPLTGTRIKLANGNQLTTATTGVGHDRVTVYTF